MASNTDDLRDLFMTVSDESTLTESQTETGSGDRLEEESVEVPGPDSREALADAVAGAEVDDGAASS